MDVTQIARQRAEQWLNSPVMDEVSRQEITALLAPHNAQQLTDRFYKNLEFGTGGLRGIMDTGSNCMNQYTVGMATQGLSNYLKKTFAGKKITVAIAHDSRNKSRYFAEVTAAVFSANGIAVQMFSELRPTPLLSFAVRYLKCQAGVVITASHNPPEYNGYKVYWEDGAQIVAPHDKNIVAEVNAITDLAQIKFNTNTELIGAIGPEVEQAYYAEVLKRIPKPDIIKKHHQLPLVYSSLHGAGITMVPECLKKMGFTNLHLVEQQSKPDGNFPTVHSPNPEEASAMEMAIQKARQVNASLAMATDPDTDRVGIAIRHPEGHYMLLNGNQALSLMMWFILENLSGQERQKGFVAKTIVTTELIDVLAQYYQVPCYNTLTGFKYIAAVIREREGREKFIAAGEESYGYMVGDFVRDKDAVSACAFFAAMQAIAHHEGKTLYHWLVDLYVKFGFYKEGLINVVKKGQQGESEMKALMQRLRHEPPAAIAGKPVMRVLDYLTLTDREVHSGKTRKLSFPQSDVLQFYLRDGSKISVRPSGTEPKIKYYISVHAPLTEAGKFEEISFMLDNRIADIGRHLQHM
ncbi:MAG: phosphoglucomutase [Cyclobacteriaceae bacterium]|nr:MAG: phosphoglucomutase [Cyclobacteriaceae bacterium]